MAFRKVAKLILISIVMSMVLTFVFDFITILAYREEVRVQTYIGGFYVSGMSADAGALASGEKDPSKLYKKEDIEKEFINFVKASFGGLASDSRYDIKDEGSVTHIRYKVDYLMLKDIIASCEYIPGGVAITIEYRVDPRVNMILGDTPMPDFPLYRVRTTRKFRILGQ